MLELLGRAFDDGKPMFLVRFGDAYPQSGSGPAQARRLRLDGPYNVAQPRMFSSQQATEPLIEKQRSELPESRLGMALRKLSGATQRKSDVVGRLIP